MKIYFAISILVQLLLAFLSSNKNKVAYMIYLWRNLFDYGVVDVKNNSSSDSASLYRKSKPESDPDKYSFLLER
jgi:hypothetical protein